MKKDEELRQRNIESLMSQNGGYVDANMHALDIADAKIIGDLFNKF